MGAAIAAGLVLACTVLFGIVGVGGLSAFIFGCSWAETYKFEEKGWSPPVYSTVSEMVTRTRLCNDSFNVWLCIMMVFVLAAVVWVVANRPRAVWAAPVVVCVAFVMAASGTGIIIRHPHQPMSAWWEWQKRVAAGSKEPYVEPAHDSSHHDVGAALVFAGLLGVMLAVTWTVAAVARRPDLHTRVVALCVAAGVTASMVVALLIAWQLDYAVYPWEYAYLYMLICTGTCAGFVATAAARAPYYDTLETPLVL